jgi:hypothetical protein
MRQFMLAGVCVLATGALCGQTIPKSPIHNPGQSSRIGAVSFTYDAQHGQIAATGMQMQPHAANISITPTTGKIVVTVHINAETHFVTGTQFQCTLLAIGGELDTTDAVVGGGIETVNRTASNNVCTLSIPYSWIVPPTSGASTGLILAVGVAAVSGGTVSRSTLQVGGVEGLPPNGSTTSLTVDVVL